MTDDADDFETLWFGITRNEIRALPLADRARFLAALRRHVQARLAAGDEFTSGGRPFTPEDRQKAAQARRRRAETLTPDPEVPPNARSAS